MRWIKNLTWIVLLGAVCMTLVWWWQEHQKDQAVRAELINTAQTAPQEPQPAPVAEPTVAPTESSVIQTPVAQDTTAQVTENPVETAATPTGVENTPNTTTQTTSEHFIQTRQNSALSRKKGMAMIEEFIRRRFRPDEHWFTGNCY